MILSQFDVYDIYRATCTRSGFIDMDSPSAVDTSGVARLVEASVLQPFPRKMIYMEFGDLERIQHNLSEYPDALDGLAVEVHLHLFCKTGTAGSKYNARRLVFGIVDSRIESDQVICYNNLSDASVFPERIAGDAFPHTVYGELPLSVDTPVFIDDNITDVTFYASKGNSAASVLDAIKNKAIIIGSFASGAFNNDGLTGGANAAQAYYTDEYAPYVEVILGSPKPDVDYLDAYSKPEDGSYVSPYGGAQFQIAYQCKNEIFTYDRANVFTRKTDGTYTWILEENVQQVDQYIIGGSTPAGKGRAYIKNSTDATETTVEFEDGALSCLIPSDILSVSTFYWRPAALTKWGAETASLTWRLVTTVDSIPTTKIVSPKNVYVSVLDGVLFEWTHIISTGTDQSKYEIQVLIDDEWSKLQDGATYETKAYVPAISLSSQMSAWRVRTANSDGVYGEYSDPAKIIISVAPIVTSVSVSDRNVQPIISWQANDQQGYEVMVDDASTGVHYGTQKTYAWQELLPDGEHIVKVRVVNRFGLFSDWASVVHVVSNAGLETAPVLTAVAANGLDVELRWTGAGYSAVRIYRDGALLDKLTGDATQYTDHASTGRHVYSVRVSDASGNYADSAPAVADPQILDAAIAVEGVWDWVRLVYAPGADAPQRSVSLAPVYALNYYSGRAYPAVEMSAHRSATYSVSYALDDAGDAERLRGMLGRVVVHKRRDELLRGLLQSVSEVRTCWGEEVTLSIVEVSDD